MRILYITTIGSTMCFFTSLIKELLDRGHSIDIATNEENATIPVCYREWNLKVYQMDFNRSPLNKGNIKAYKQLKKLVSDNHYDIVHCHTPVAGAIARMVCRKFRKDGLKVIYTAHGFHFYNGAPLKNWLIYYPIEKFCSRFTDVLITINSEDFERAEKKMKAKCVDYIPGVGIDVDKFADAVVDRAAKRRELGIPEDAFLLFSVGELNKNKNHQIVIRALAELKNPDIHYMIAGQGPLYDFLLDLAKNLHVSDQIHLLGYRNDTAELYKTADVDVFPSIREGLGLAAVEGMAAGLPLICSDNRGTREYARVGENAIVCNKLIEYVQAIDYLQAAENSESLGENARVVANRFDKNNVNKIMMKIYGW